MSKLNDDAWEHYLQAKNIILDGQHYEIEASELRQITNREPRLLAKFDTPEQLPKPFERTGYSLLPVRNGKYLLFPGDLFVKVPYCTNRQNFTPSYGFPLLTEGRGRSESQYIDQAYNTGLLADFLQVGDLFLTIRGRERTGEFSFSLSNLEIHVEGVQIEVDAGYEALTDIVLIEAKIGKPDFFNVRQLYYPFRHFSTLVPQKNIRNVFLIYDLYTHTYSVYEYIFNELHRPASIQLAHCFRYQLPERDRLTIHELIDARFQSNKNEIAPQADDLNKIFELLLLIDVGLNHRVEITDYFAFDERQTSYYREAAEYLNLVLQVGSTGYYDLTELGAQLVSTPILNQREILAKIVVNSWIFTELLRDIGNQTIISYETVENIIGSVIKDDGSPRYSGSTISRRRQTITAWMDWLSQEIGCFEKIDNIYKLR